MEQQVQQLQSQLVQLKAQMYDANQANAAMDSQLKEMTSVLQQIVNIFGIMPKEGQETISFADIVETLKSHAPVQEEVVE